MDAVLFKHIKRGLIAGLLLMAASGCSNKSEEKFCEGDDQFLEGTSVCAAMMEMLKDSSDWTWPEADRELQILGMRWVSVTPNHTALEVETTIPIYQILYEVGGSIYRHWAGSDRYWDSSGQGPACMAYYETSGRECTSDCLEACECFTCEDKTAQRNGRDACAMNCTSQVHAGNVGQRGATFANEAEVAEVVFLGLDGIPGLVDGFPSDCNADQCEIIHPVARFEFKHPAGEFLKNFTVGTMVAVSNPVQPSYSPPATAPASLSASCGPPGSMVTASCYR